MGSLQSAEQCPLTASRGLGTLVLQPWALHLSSNTLKTPESGIFPSLREGQGWPTLGFQLAETLARELSV